MSFAEGGGPVGEHINAVSLNKIKMSFLDIEGSRSEVSYCSLDHDSSQLLPIFIEWLNGGGRSKTFNGSALLSESGARQVKLLRPLGSAIAINPSVKSFDIKEILIIGRVCVALQTSKGFFAFRDQPMVAAATKLYKAIGRLSLLMDARDQEDKDEA